MADSGSPRRHWNGTVGNRHEHQNVWMYGGVRGPAVTSPWAGWDAHRQRRNSDTSTSSSISPVNSNNNNGNNDSTTRRRSSTSSAKALFANLADQKRNSSSDPTISDRRKSYSDQNRTPVGLFATWWHGYTRGP